MPYVESVSQVKHIWLEFLFADNGTNLNVELHKLKQDGLLNDPVLKKDSGGFY